MKSRDTAISKYVGEYLHTTGISRETYAQGVVEQYHQRIETMQRSIKFHTDGDTYKDMRANAQIVRRWLDGETRMPCEVEESLVMALPAEWQQGLLAILAARYGLLAAPIPNHNGKTDIQHVGDLAKEFADLLSAIAPALATNNSFGLEDAHLAKRILKEADDLDAALTTIRRIVTDLLPDNKLKVVAHGKG